MDRQALDTFFKTLPEATVPSIPQKIVWLSGAPGAGKGTNERYIIEFGHLHENPLVASSCLNSPEMRAKINKGQLLDDPTVISAVFDGLQDLSYRDGVVVDGFPRTEGQAYSIEWLAQAKQARGEQAHFYVLVLMLDEDESIRRQLYRGQRAQEHNTRVKKSGHGTLKEVRATDLDPEIARHRYKLFMEETYAALLTLKGKFPFVAIDGNGSLNEVKARVLQAVKQLRINE